MNKLLSLQVTFISFLYSNETNVDNKDIILEISPEKKDLIIILSILLIIFFILIVYISTKIYHKRKLLDIVLNSCDDIIYYKDQRLRYIGCNDAFLKYIGKKREEVIGRDDFEIFENKYAKIFRDSDLKILRTNKKFTDEICMDLNGKKSYFQSKKVPLKYHSNGSIGILGMSRDVTNFYNIQKKLEEQTTIDELTKANNRKSFNERIKEKIDMYNRYESIFCIALLDIDDFKNVNDSLGHDIGDKVLITLCEIIRENIRNTDMLFRIGGEEFVIIYPKTYMNDAYFSTEKLRRLIKKKEIIEELSVTISIGLTQVKTGDDEEKIFKRVDELMYLSKNNGKDRTTID